MKTETVQICPKCGSPGKFTYILHDSPEESSASPTKILDKSDCSNPDCTLRR